MAALPSTGVFQDEISIDTRRDAGSQESDPIEAVEITDLDIRAQGLVPADVQELSVAEDSTNDDPFDGNGTEVVDVTVPEGATRFVANLNNATAPDFDLYVGSRRRRGGERRREQRLGRLRGERRRPARRG